MRLGNVITENGIHLEDIVDVIPSFFIILNTFQDQNQQWLYAASVTTTNTCLLLNCTVLQTI